jgi:acyl carrier protein
LCIGGPGVANGYLHRPDITAERFVHLDAAGGIVYRTGDLARELPTGDIEFLGRRDRQVKIRGFRVELDEIERAAVETGLVDAAFVELDGEGSSAVLVGLVLTTVSSFDPQVLGARLSAVLPAYMVPVRWIVLPRLPLGPTGKADRKAMARLARQERGGTAAATVGDPLVDVVMSILYEELADATPDANFIELGGNSIQAVKAAHRIGHKLAIDVQPVEVLSAPTLNDLATGIARRSSVLAN